MKMGTGSDDERFGLAHNMHLKVRVMNSSRNKSCKTNQFASALCGGRGKCPTSSPDPAGSSPGKRDHQ